MDVQRRSPQRRKSTDILIDPATDIPSRAYTLQKDLEDLESGIYPETDARIS